MIKWQQLIKSLYLDKNIPSGGGYILVASAKTEEEVSKIELSGFEANEILVITKLKKTGDNATQMIPVLTLNGKWGTADPYININASLPTSYFQHLTMYAFAKDGNVFVRAEHNDGIKNVFDNQSFEKITSVEIERVGTPNFAVGCEVLVYAR